MDKCFLICINRRTSPTAASCGGRGSLAIADAIEKGLLERGIELKVTRIYCFGQCERGPNMRLAPGGEFFRGVRLEDVPKVLDALEEAAGCS